MRGDRRPPHLQRSNHRDRHPVLPPRSHQGPAAAEGRSLTPQPTRQRVTGPARPTPSR
ncbi:hypothetical protein L4B83_02885 [Streptomyces sp. PSAA01]|nr:hypothetical protein [Streptomyces sp. PSAA01]